VADDSRRRGQVGLSVRSRVSTSRGIYECRDPGCEMEQDSNPRLRLREDILRRRDADQEARKAVFKGEPDALARAMRVDDENAEWLRRILPEWGWPGYSLVGEDGAHAAWLLAQHADRHPALQKQCLTLLEQAVASGEASAADLAFLSDRVLLASGDSQIYGTQLTTRDGRFAACRLRDPETVNARRAAVGLDTLEAYLSTALETFGAPTPARVICPNCRAEIEAWLPELGGRSSIRCNSCHSTYQLRPAIPQASRQ